MGDGLAGGATAGPAARRAAAARARRRDRTGRWPGLHRVAIGALSGGPARTRGPGRAGRADPRRVVRAPGARAPAAQPGGAGAAHVQPEPGAGRCAAPPAALPRPGDRAARSRARAGRARRRRRGAAARPGTPAERRAGAGPGHRTGRFPECDGRYAQGDVSAGDRAPQRARIRGGRPRNAAAGGNPRRPESQLRLRQWQLRHVQGARHLRRCRAHSAHRLSAVAGRKNAGLRAGLRPHGGQQRADDRDPRGRRPGRHSRPADRRQRAGDPAAGQRHDVAAPADTAQPAPALPGRPVRDAGHRRRRQRRGPSCRSRAVPATIATCTSSWPGKTATRCPRACSAAR